MKNFINKYYHLFVIVAVAAFLLGVRWLSVNTEATKPVKHTTSMVRIRESEFKKALNESCSYSSGTLTCPESVIHRITRNVDSLESKTEQSVTFYEKGRYIDVPATMLVNMIEAGLFKQSEEKK